MKQSFLTYLACPDCGSDIEVASATQKEDAEILEGELKCTDCARLFSIVRGIPRFVRGEAYAKSFGLQWNKYPVTQRDSSNGTRIFHKRFQNVTGWPLQNLKDCVVLDAGCGPGSFVDVVAPHCKAVMAVDLSAAAEACYASDGRKPNVHVVQGDIFNLPFKKGRFDRVYSIGVLQHTPDPQGALESLCQYVDKNGQLAFWGYDFKLSYFFSPRFLLRQLVSRMSPEAAEVFLGRYTPKALKLRRKVRKLPMLGRYLEKAVFVTDYTHFYPELSDSQLDEWARMDTYDALATKYEIRLPIPTYRRVLERNRFQVTEVRKDGTGSALVARKI